MTAPRAPFPAACLLLLASLTGGCGQVADAPAATHEPTAHPAASELSPAVMEELRELRAATAPFRDFERARAAGYGTQLTDCFEEADGGMGFHYGRTDLIDGSAALTEPEILMYEPQADGALTLVGVEYAIPLEAWTGAQPPTLLGQSFHVNERFGLWVLHVWAWSHNPAGIFADWNPLVTCRAART